MKLHLLTFAGHFARAIRGMFNLNDPRWGRDDETSSFDNPKPLRVARSYRGAPNPRGNEERNKRGVSRSDLMSCGGTST
jgi:membrane protease subunit HflK